MLNEKMLKERNVSRENETLLKMLHEDMDTLLKHIKKNIAVIDKPFCAARVQHLEYLMQDAWGFARDSSYHTYWLRVEGCECPKMDNKDPMYFGIKIHSSDCEWHGRDI